MNARVVVAVVLLAAVVVGALLFSPKPNSAPQAVQSSENTPKPAPVKIDKAALEAMRKASEASTKQANAVQANAQKVAAEVAPVLEGYSFLTNESELIMSYAVNFDPQQNSANTTKFASALAKNWKIKELGGYKPKKVTIEFYFGKDRLKATRSFDPSGKPL